MSHVIDDGIYGESYTTKYLYKPCFEYLQTYIPYFIHPNMITIVNFILLFYLYISKKYYNNYIFAIFLGIFFALDCLDGIHARKTERQSKLGELLDHGLDIIRNIFVLKMIFDITKYKKYMLLYFLVLLYDLFLLISKYTQQYLYGFKFFSIDDVSVLLIIFVLFIKKINHQILTFIFCIMQYIFFFTLGWYFLYIFKLNISHFDVFLLVVLIILNYFNRKNILMLSIINFIYAIYIII